MYVQLIDHPLAAARLTTMWDENSDNAGFRTALRELTTMLVYEATHLPVPYLQSLPADLSATPAVQGWIGESSGPVNARHGPHTPAARIRARASRSEIRSTWCRHRCSVR